MAERITALEKLISTPLTKSYWKAKMIIKQMMNKEPELCYHESKDHSQRHPNDIQAEELGSENLVMDIAFVNPAKLSRTAVLTISVSFNVFVPLSFRFSKYCVV